MFTIHCTSIFQISLNFVQNVTILPKIAKHGPIDHCIIAKIFVIVINYVPMRKMLYTSHDLRKLDTTTIFQFLSIFAQNVTIYPQNSQIWKYSS